MACVYHYQGKVYDQEDFIGILLKMNPSEASKYMPGVTSVPEAPFVGNTAKYVGLALRRMVRYAAEGGYDTLAWTPGSVQADRYDLSKHIERVVYSADNRLHAYNHGNTRVIDEVVEEKDLDDYIGKEAAGKLLDAKPSSGGTGSFGLPGDRIIRGLDLKVGGEGMKGFYDKILPAVANKFFGKSAWGKARVRTVKINTGDKRQISQLRDGIVPKEYEERLLTEAHALPITPEMKSRAIREGMPLFSTELPEGTQTAETVNKDLPGNGVTFDGIQEGVEEDDNLYQFTARDGKAKGATFYTESLDVGEVKTRLNEIIESFKGTAQYSTKQKEEQKKEITQDSLSVIDKVKSILEKPKLTIKGKEDLKYFSDLIISIPAFFKDKIPAVRSMFNATQERMDEYHGHIFDMEHNNGVNIKTSFDELSSESYKKVKNYLLETDRTDSGFKISQKKDKWTVKHRDGKEIYTSSDETRAIEAVMEFEAADLQDKGFTPQEAGAVMAFRQSTNKGFEMLFGAMRRIIRAADEAGIDIPEVIVQREGRATQINLQQAMAEMGDMRGSYFPRIRSKGRYVMVAKKAGEDSILEPYSIKRFQNPRIKELENKGYQVTTSKSKQLGEDVFEAAGSLIKTQQIINAALEKIELKTKDVSQQEIQELFKGMESIFASSVAEQVSNIIRERGARVSMGARSRELFLGYEEDPKMAIAKYIRGLSGGESKRNMVIKMLRAFTGTEKTWAEFKSENPGATFNNYRDHVKEAMIDQREQPNAFKWGKAYIAETTRNPEFADNVVGVLRGAAVGKYLAFRVFSAPLVNLTALPTSTIASMNGAGIPYRITWRHLGKGIELYGRYRSNPDKMNPEDRWIFDHIREKGWDDAQFSSESLSVLRSTLGKGWDKVIDIGMFTFSESERLNRAATISGTFRGLSALTENKGKTKEQIAQMAKEVSDDSHGIYNKGNYPYIALGGNPAAHTARMFYVFQRFGHTYLLNMRKLGFEKKDFSALAHMVVAPAILAGAGASVITPILDTMLRAFGIDEPEEEVYKTIGEHISPVAENFARFGLAGLAGRGPGVSIKGSLALGVGAIPTTLKDILGAPGSVVSDVFLEGIPAVARGDIKKGFEKILPTGFGNIIRAYREATEGLTTRTNQPIFYGNEQVRLDRAEWLLRTLSLYPARIAKIREQQWKEKRLEGKYSKKRREIYAQIKKYYLADKKSPDRMVDIIAQIDVYNEKAADAKPPHTLITKQSIRTNLKRAFRPSKRERRREAAR